MEKKARKKRWIKFAFIRNSQSTHLNGSARREEPSRVHDFAQITLEQQSWLQARPYSQTLCRASETCPSQLLADLKSKASSRLCMHEEPGLLSVSVMSSFAHLIAGYCLVTLALTCLSFPAHSPSIDPRPHSSLSVATLSPLPFHHHPRPSPACFSVLLRSIAFNRSTSFATIL